MEIAWRKLRHALLNTYYFVSPKIYIQERIFRMTFKEKIVKLRKLKGLTQDEFASAVGVSRQAVYKWECGQSYPEVSKLLEIKFLFGISIDDLLDESYEVIIPEKKKRKRKPKDENAAPAVAKPAAPAVKAEPAPVKEEPKKEEEPAFAPMADEDIRNELLGLNKKLTHHFCTC